MCHQVGNAEVLVVASYGFANRCMEGKRPNDLLLAAIASYVDQVGLPFMICGDLNEPPMKLASFEFFRNLGAVEAFSWFESKSGKKILRHVPVLPEMTLRFCILCFWLTFSTWMYFRNISLVFTCLCKLYFQFKRVIPAFLVGNYQKESPPHPISSNVFMNPLTFRSPGMMPVMTSLRPLTRLFVIGLSVLSRQLIQHWRFNTRMIHRYIHRHPCLFLTKVDVDATCQRPKSCAHRSVLTDMGAIVPLLKFSPWSPDTKSGRLEDCRLFTDVWSRCQYIRMDTRIVPRAWPMRFWSGARSDRPRVMVIVGRAGFLRLKPYHISMHSCLRWRTWRLWRRSLGLIVTIPAWRNPDKVQRLSSASWRSIRIMTSAGWHTNLSDPKGHLRSTRYRWIDKCHTRCCDAMTGSPVFALMKNEDMVIPQHAQVFLNEAKVQVTAQPGRRGFFRVIEGSVDARGHLRVQFTALTPDEITMITTEFSAFWKPFWQRDRPSEQFQEDTWRSFLGDPDLERLPAIPQIALDSRFLGFKALDENY